MNISKFLVICMSAIMIGILRGQQSLRQTPYCGLTVRGYYKDPITGKIDDTLGFAAFDAIMKYLDVTCLANFDNGGGAHDDTTKYLKRLYNIENVVYEAFLQSFDHSNKVLALIKTQKFDMSTSMSVLNVIDTLELRLEHTQLTFDFLKENGVAFFRLWPGDSTGIARKTDISVQSNKPASCYVHEVALIFGKNNVFLVDEKTIEAIIKIF
jgi:hypothetical protein